jgi:hypothetical protein
MGHHIEKRKAVILKKFALVSFKPQLLPKLIDLIDVDVDGSGDRQITEKGGVDKTLQRLV